MKSSEFWRGKKVFLTGHTGFKGSWLCLWLSSLGAHVTGYALEPPTTPNLFEAARISELVDSRIADIRDPDRIKTLMSEASPEIVIHMAAQPLVRHSYTLPVDTFATNVMGTVHLLEAIRSCPSVKAALNVTTDKCYENREWVWGYRENDPMGGYDPYSSSKGCSELVTASYRNSFLQHSVAVATARAGNVIGGGDWSADRLIPDCINALMAGKPIRIRNPHAIRPWQHVLEPLSGYMTLVQRLYVYGSAYAEGWNFGPADDDARPVSWIVDRMCQLWGNGARFEVESGNFPHEANYLKLDCSKAHMRLGWRPRWDLNQSLASILQWVNVYSSAGDIRTFSVEQINQFEAESERRA